MRGYAEGWRRATAAHALQADAPEQQVAACSQRSGVCQAGLPLDGLLVSADAAELT